MFRQIALGLVLLLTTVAIHAVATYITFEITRRSHIERWRLSVLSTATVVISGIVLMMFLATLAEATLWAAVYVISDAFSSLSTALYFSIVTYTTLGYGDVVVGPEWRLMAALQAANGVIMFGWTTGILVYAVQRLPSHLQHADRGSDVPR